jgi:hypothetical protein
MFFIFIFIVEIKMMASICSAKAQIIKRQFAYNLVSFSACRNLYLLRFVHAQPIHIQEAAQNKVSFSGFSDKRCLLR